MSSEPTSKLIRLRSPLDLTGDLQQPDEFGRSLMFDLGMAEAVNGKVQACTNGEAASAGHLVKFVLRQLRVLGGEATVGAIVSVCLACPPASEQPVAAMSTARMYAYALSVLSLQRFGGLVDMAVVGIAFAEGFPSHAAVAELYAEQRGSHHGLEDIANLLDHPELLDRTT